MIAVNGVRVVPTIFPDKTSQMWKLPDTLLEQIYKDAAATITWEFESEAEFMHVAQLKTLLDTYADGGVALEMPYLPYARQDKRVDNHRTFALVTFARLINSLAFSVVNVVDAHCPARAHAIERLNNESPDRYVRDAVRDAAPTTIILPDAGAVVRYTHTLQNVCPGLPNVVCDKVRDQETGKITGMHIFADSLAGETCLIVDDLVDGGATFCAIASEAKRLGAAHVHLYCTHAVLSRGTTPLREAGIERIYSRTGEIK